MIKNIQTILKICILLFNYIWSKGAKLYNIIKEYKPNYLSYLSYLYYLNNINILYI